MANIPPNNSVKISPKEPKPISPTSGNGSTVTFTSGDKKTPKISYTKIPFAEKESKAHPWNIRASRSYYEVKLNGEAEVIQISKRIDKLKSEMVVLKSSYRQAMVNLDAISTQV